MSAQLQTNNASNDQPKAQQTCRAGRLTQQQNPCNGRPNSANTGPDRISGSTQFSWRGKISEFQADPCYGSINNNA
nr:hypothetical protein [Escherichia coli]